MGTSISAIKELIHTDIFFPSYTHCNADSARVGIEKTGKLMAPSIALAHDIVPFCGESLGMTYFFRAYHVSVSRYPPADKDQSWHRYLSYGKQGWSVESSEAFIKELRASYDHIRNAKPNMANFQYPYLRGQQLAQIEECVHLETLRQETFKTLPMQQQMIIQNPKPDIYLLNDTLPITFNTKVWHEYRQADSHPSMPAEINLSRYLQGMVTSHDIKQTKEWISNIAGKEIPVASIDTLIAWENTIRKLRTHEKESDGNTHTFYWKIREDLLFKQKVIKEVLSL